MRRDEFSSVDDEDFQYISENAIVGYLGIIDQRGYPRIVPLNFVSIDKTIYFHGANKGEKYELLKEGPKATFSIDIPYAFYPSYWVSKKSACPASHFFKSIHIRGQGVIVDDLDEKCVALNSIMEKYQPEGNYIPLSSTKQMYKKPLQEVGVFKIIPGEITIKIKFGQNIDEKKINKIINGLQQRNSEIDQATIAEINLRRQI